MFAGCPRRGSSGIQREEDGPSVFAGARRQGLLHVASVERDDLNPGDRTDSARRPMLRQVRILHLKPVSVSLRLKNNCRRSCD